MEWFQVLTIVFAVFGIFLWSRREARSDMRTFQTEIRSWKEEIQKESKDFHGRLCKLEERKK